MKKIILIFVALRSELPSLQGFDSTNAEVKIIYTGVGKINALQAINNEFAKLNRVAPLDIFIINAGTCGSTKHKLLTPLVPNIFTQGDAFQKAPFKSPNYTFCASDDSMSQAVICATSDRFMDSHNKDFQEFEFPIDCYEMEAYSYARFCAEHRLPFTAIKVVSDNCDGTIKEWHDILNQTAPIISSHLKLLISAILSK